MNRWQFSLRGLFIATTLVAAAIFFFLQFPVLAICSVVGLVLAVLQYGVERSIGFLSVRAPSAAKAIFVAIGIGFVILSVYISAQVGRNVPPEDLPLRWLPVGIFGGVGVLCCVAAYCIPDKPPNGPTREPDAGE